MVKAKRGHITIYKGTVMHAAISGDRVSSIAGCVSLKEVPLSNRGHITILRYTAMSKALSARPPPLLIAYYQWNDS